MGKQKLMVFMLVSTLLCGCTGKGDVKAQDSSKECASSVVSENNDINGDNAENRSYEKIMQRVRLDSDYMSLSGLNTNGKYTYVFAESEHNYENDYFGVYNFADNTVDYIRGSYDNIGDCDYINGKYYTLEYDVTDNTRVCYICTYNENLSEPENCAVWSESTENGNILSDDVVYLNDDSQVTFIDPKLNILKTINILDYNEYIKVDDFFATTSLATVDKNKNIYFFSYSKELNLYYLCKIDSAGSWVYGSEDFYDLSASCNGGICGFFEKDGKLYIACTSDTIDGSMVFLNVVDADTGKTENRYEIENADTVCRGYGEYDITYSYGDSIFGYDLEKEESTLLYTNEEWCMQGSWFVYDEGEILSIRQLSDDMGSCMLVFDEEMNIVNKVPVNNYMESKLFFKDNTAYLAELNYVADNNCEVKIKKSENGIDFEEYLCLTFEKEILYLYNFFVGDNENLWLMCGDINRESSFEIFDKSGNYIKSLPMVSWHSPTVLNNDNQKYMIGFNRDNQICTMDIDEQNLSFSDENVVCEEHGIGMLFDPARTDKRSVYAYAPQDNTVCEIDCDTREIKEVLNIAQFGLDMIYDMVKISDTDYVVLGTSSNGGMALYKIFESETEIQTLVLAGTNISPDIRNAVLDFNDYHSDIRIVCKDYSVSDDSYFIGESALDQDIISENIPDIIITDNICLEKYTDKNLFADLKTYIENDSDINIDDYFSDVFVYSDDKSKIYTVNPVIDDILTISLPDKYAEFANGWTLEDFCSFAENNPEEVPDGYLDMWDFLLYSYIRENVDYENEKCNFETEEFYRLLDVIKNNMYDENIGMTEAETDIKFCDAMMFSEFVQESYSGEEQVFAGLPSNDNTAFIMRGSGFGISEKSENKDIAWLFIREFLTDEYQDKLVKSYGSPFPSNKQKMKASIENDAMYIMNGIGGTSIDTKRLDKVFGLLERPVMTNYKNNKIFGIAVEETEKFLAGEETAESVAKNIQGICSKYLAES
ncbi:MAG: extracellular solute-binding protein [Ruminococcus sp.]|nr:extracellular solute-binding protein [Ruminococcus sp.]